MFYDDVEKIGCKIVRLNTEGRKFEQSIWLSVSVDICYPLSDIRVLAKNPHRCIRSFSSVGLEYKKGAVKIFVCPS